MSIWIGRSKGIPCGSLKEEEGEDVDGLMAEEAGAPEKARRRLHGVEGKPHHARRGCGDLRPAAEEVEPSPPPSGGGPLETGLRAQRRRRDAGRGNKVAPRREFPRGCRCRISRFRRRRSSGGVRVFR
ncbi:hypothetical protein GW17_00039695 [Ensete ventricosum]|nr:hypothetical protein GW17_00039695 [Ensete ventricosum]